MLVQDVVEIVVTTHVLVFNLFGKTKNKQHTSRGVPRNTIQGMVVSLKRPTYQSMVKIKGGVHLYKDTARLLVSTTIIRDNTAELKKSLFVVRRAVSFLAPTRVFIEYYLSTSRSAFLLYLNVKLVPFFAYVLEGRSISIPTWISAFLAFVGTVLLSSDGTPPNVGDLWSVLAAATSAMFILRLEKYSGRCDASKLNSANLWITAGLCGLWAGTLV